jgi:hypothetical protein
MNRASGWVLVLGVLLIFALGAYFMIGAIREATNAALQPVGETTGGLATQVAQLLHPTPTVLPDPVAIIHEMRSLARLETVQYSIERVITAETGEQGIWASLFGDKLLFVAHGVVIAGVDLEKMRPEDIWVRGGVLYVRLPPAEVFVATLDNEKSYVYDRDTGLLTKGDINLESEARRVAEASIEEAALDDGILEVARRNAEAYFALLLRDLGYPEVIFEGD